MAVSSYQNATDGTISEKQGTRDTNGTVPLTEDKLLLQPVNPYDETLPGTETVKARPNINWLGTSYSGADISVVAHLYTAPDLTKSIASIEDEKLAADLAVLAANNLASNKLGVLSIIGQVGVGFEEKRRQFVQLCGLTNVGELGNNVSSMLVRDVLRPAFNLPIFLAIHGLIEAAKENYTIWQERLKAKLAYYGVQAKEGSATVKLATLQTLSVQTHREKFEVRACGRSTPKGITRGPRTVAGSMIFTTFNEHALSELIRHMGNKESIHKEPEIRSLLPDQLPPLDLTIVFANEYGSLSQQTIYGVDFVNDGSVMSVEDLIVENTVNFMARDADVMTSAGMIPLSRYLTMRDVDEKTSLAASDLLFNNDNYDRFLEKLGIRKRRVNR